MLKNLTHEELKTTLQNLTNRKITQQLIADALGYEQSRIGKRAKRNTEYSTEELIKIGNFFNVTLVEKKDEVINKILTGYIDNNKNPLITTFVAAYYPEVFGSCGNGTFTPSELKETVSIPKTFVKSYSPVKKYSVIRARGDSMFPRIENNDRLIVEEYSGEQIIDNQIYVFCYDDKIFVKRLVFNINQLVVVSDNEDKTIYPNRYIDKDDINNVLIIGKIVGLMREF